MENLTTTQKSFLHHVLKKGKSTFLTGESGTGKSFVLKLLIQELRKLYGKRVGITASTGIAAHAIGGITLHRFAGIGLGKDSIPKSIAILKKNAPAFTQWKETRVLVVDEISMISREFFEKLNEVAQKIRNNNQLFGGIQIIICGDFMQLPPVNTLDFLFESDVFTSILQEGCFILREIFRQTDSTFLKILSEARIGSLSQESQERLQQLKHTALDETDISLTRLMSHRVTVEKVNRQALDKLPGKNFSFNAADYVSQNASKDIAKNFRFPDVLLLKKGAQVVYLKNDTATGLFCGARGVVKRIEKKESEAFVVVKFACIDQDIPIDLAREEIENPAASGKIIASRTQFPLMLAWALTIHRSQGMTLDRLEVDLGACFEPGMGYVAISRATSLKGLRVVNFRAKSFFAHPRIIDFYNKLYQGKILNDHPL